MSTGIRLFRYSKNMLCYYCGRVPNNKSPNSKEHVPPEMMFKSFDCDSITVPACENHNTNRNIGDRAVVTAMIMGAYKVQMRYPNSPRITSNISKAINESIQNFPQAKKEVELRGLIYNPPKTLDMILPYIQAKTKICSWMRQLTAGLIWSIIGKHEPYFDWDKTLVWSPGYHLTSGPLTLEEATKRVFQSTKYELKLNSFDWRPGWSAHPRSYPKDIYSFELCFLKSPQDWDGMNIVFRHHFYNGISVWYTWFMISPKTKERISIILGI